MLTTIIMLNGVNVTIKLEGENYLKGSAPGLGFAGATPNVDGETEGSTLTIEGEGSLNARGGGFSAAIGSGYTGYHAAAGDANNIIINSGNITATGGGNHSAGIGGGNGKNANNIIINGGNINITPGSFAPGIRASGTIINGGEININSNSWTLGISGTTHITGGKINITASGNTTNGYRYTALGNGGNIVAIEGGTISCRANANAGIFNGSEGVVITGGNILSEGLGDIGKLDSENNFVQGYATNEDGNNVYLTKLQLQGVAENKKVTSFATSDNITYGIEDMYTLEGGMLYVYLPAGTRTVNVTVDGVTYSRQVITDAQNSQGIQLLQ